MSNKSDRGKQIGGDPAAGHQQAQDTPEQTIPNFRNREELAEYWDTHDLTDVIDDLTPAEVHIADSLREPLSVVTQVRFDKQTDRQLEARARARGVKKSTLVRMWVLERLKQDAEASAL
ncbi:MAG TPA: CopG family antitoxin [Ktedonobacterales bacterium]